MKHLILFALASGLSAQQIGRKGIMGPERSDAPGSRAPGALKGIEAREANR